MSNHTQDYNEIDENMQDYNKLINRQLRDINDLIKKINEKNSGHNELKSMKHHIDCINNIINFRKYVDGLNHVYVLNVIYYIQKWINIYMKTNIVNDYNRQFYNHIYQIEKLYSTIDECPIRSQYEMQKQYEQTITNFWNSLNQFVELKECHDFAKFLKSISS